MFSIKELTLMSGYGKYGQEIKIVQCASTEGQWLELVSVCRNGSEYIISTGHHVNQLLPDFKSLTTVQPN